MIRRYSTVLAAVLLAALASCVGGGELATEEQTAGIVLTLDTGQMQLVTKAQPDTRPGDEDGSFNENLISGNAQVFFFDPDADDSTPARWNQSIPLNGTLLQIDVTMADLAAIFGSRNPQAGDQATVIVATNYDGESFDMAGHNYTKSEIRARQLASADWSVHPQSSFVMLSDESTITLEDPTRLRPATGLVKMRRRAAKVTFRLTIADEIAVDNYAYSTDFEGNIVANKSIEIWRPVLDKMTVYPQYFMSDGRLGGAPTTSPTDKNSSSLFTGLGNPYKLSATTQTMTRTRKIFRKNTDGEYIKDANGNFEYDEQAVEVPLYITVYNDGDENAANNIGGPFYTYPVTWDPGIETEPFLKLIIPWQSGSDSRIKYYYYKIPFQEEALEANNWYEVTLDVQILGGEEDLPVPLAPQYHVVDWVPGVEAQTATVSARYLSVPTKSFTMYNVEELEIPMISSHACEIVSATYSKPNYKSGTPSTGDAASWLSISAERPLEAILFGHTLNNTVGSTLDCTPYTITFRVRHIDDTDYYEDITIVQYPAIYMEPMWDLAESTDAYSDANHFGNVFVDGYYGNVNRKYKSTDSQSNSGNSGTNSDSTISTPYGKLQTYIDSGDQRNMTDITVTAFNESSKSYSIYNGSTTESYDYIIADPRTTTKSWSTLTAYWNGSGTTAWTTDQINPIKIAQTSDDYRNYIAPQFMISSKWGRNQGGKQAWENAQRRCATYQEAGYPAGRWRLPTEAEVMFIVNLERYKYIEELFVNGTDYWIANQSYVTVSTSGNSTVEKESSTSSTHTQRCVYDIWYWGAEAPADHYTYTFWPENTAAPVFTATQVN